MIDPPAASVYNSTTQAVGTGTISVMLANSENYDNNGMHSTVSNTGRITIQTAGRYLFTGTVSFASTIGGNSHASVSLLVNGTTRLNGIGGQIGNAVFGCVATAARTAVLSAGDYVECEAFHAAGVTVACTLQEFSALYLTR